MYAVTMLSPIEVQLGGEEGGGRLEVKNKRVQTSPLKHHISARLISRNLRTCTEFSTHY